VYGRGALRKIAEVLASFDAKAGNSPPGVVFAVTLAPVVRSGRATPVFPLPTIAALIGYRTRFGCGAAIERTFMDLRKLKTLIDLVSDSNITELEITETEGKVRIVKGPPAGAVYAQQPMAMPAPTMVLAAAAPAAAVAEPAAAMPDKVIKSPMVGTFYRSASPGAKAFVELGDEVKEGQPVCIIEAMKIMNEIEADHSGKIIRMLCENGQAVEFGQPLFVVE
jgi:acetyl-CoA carboxylase biotin carboxyl carrier protein